MSQFAILPAKAFLAWTAVLLSLPPATGGAVEPSRGAVEPSRGVGEPSRGVGEPSRGVGEPTHVAAVPAGERR